MKLGVLSSPLPFICSSGSQILLQVLFWFLRSSGLRSNNKKEEYMYQKQWLIYSSVLLPVGYIHVGSTLKWSLQSIVRQPSFCLSVSAEELPSSGLLLRPSNSMECLGLSSSVIFNYNHCNTQKELLQPFFPFFISPGKYTDRVPSQFLLPRSSFLNTRRKRALHRGRIPHRWKGR